MNPRKALKSLSNTAMVMAENITDEVPSVFTSSIVDAISKELKMPTTTTTSTLTAQEVFSQIGSLLLNDVFTNALPVITTALSTIQSNPQQVLNPLNSGIFGAQFVANITATLPQIEASAVQSAATLFSSLLSVVSAKVGSANTSAAAIGTEIGNAVTGTTNTAA